MKNKFLLFIISVFAVTGCWSQTNSSVNNNTTGSNMKINIQVTNESGKTTNLIATLADNKSAKEFAEKLSEKSIELKMTDYASFEKYAKLPFKLSQTDSNITTKPGDIMLTWGNTFVIYYGRNNYDFSRLGFLDAIENKTMTQVQLMEILGKGDIVARISLIK